MSEHSDGELHFAIPEIVTGALDSHYNRCYTMIVRPVTNMKKQREDKMEIKFMKHYVTDGIKKARVHYSDTALISGNKCVTLYAKSHNDGKILQEIIPSTYENNTDIMTDYFEKGLARIMEGHPLYAVALARTATRRE